MYKINLTHPSSNVSDENIEEARNLLNVFAEKINKREKLDRIKIDFDEPKTPHGDSVLFNTTLKLFFLDGSYYVDTAKELEFLDSVRSAIDEISKQIRRDN